MRATESWTPNLVIARQRLAPWRAEILNCRDNEVPVAAGTVDLVLARHPVCTPWEGIALALAGDGTFLSQQVGSGSVRELTTAMIGPFDIDDTRDPDRAVRSAEQVGLTVDRLEWASLAMTFNDIAAVVVFLRKVIWIVPEFSIDRYRPALLRLHEQIVGCGPFRATSERFLIQAHS